MDSDYLATWLAAETGVDMTVEKPVMLQTRNPSLIAVELNKSDGVHLVDESERIVGQVA